MHKILLLILSLATMPAYGTDDTTAISLKVRVNSAVLECGAQHNAEIPVARYSAEPQYERRRFAIKTNLLYLAALMINVEGEYYFSPKFSLNLEWQYAWWDNSQQHKYYRIATASPEFRYWFHRKSMDQGHFGGVYVAAGVYECMRNERRGIRGEFFVAAGLSYGYMLPLSRALNLELSLGVGYMMTELRQYHYDAGCYVYDLTKRSIYLGPTKAKVSLVFPLGRRRTR